MRRLLPSLLVALLAGCGEAEYQPRAPITITGPVPPVTTASSGADAQATAPLQAAMTRVVFRGAPPRWSWDPDGDTTFHGWAEFGGVDEKKQLVYVAFYGAKHERGELRVIDLANGTDRTIAAPEEGTSLAKQAKAAASLADVIAATHTDATERNDFRSLHLAVSRSHVVFGDGHDGLVVADRSGADPRKLAKELSAAYHPIFSPDEKTLAFTGCTQRGLVPKGAVHQCVYRLYLSDAPFTKIRAIDSVTAPTPPVWSPDGSDVYTVSRDDDHQGSIEQADRGGTLVRVDARSGEVARIYTTDELRDVGFHQATDGETGAVFGLERDSEKPVTVVESLALPDGKALRKASIPYAATLEIGSGISNSGLMISEGKGSVMAIDLKTGSVATTPISAQKRILGFGPWKNGHVVYVLGVTSGGDAPTFEIMELDVRALLATNPAAVKPAPAEPEPDPNLPYF